MNIPVVPLKCMATACVYFLLASFFHFLLWEDKEWKVVALWCAVTGLVSFLAIFGCLIWAVWTI